MRKGLGCFFFCFFKFSLCFLAYQGIYKPQTYRNGEGLGVCLGATRYAHPPSSSSYLAGAAVRAPPGGVINGWWEWRSPQIDRQTLHKQAKGSTLGFPPGGGTGGEAKPELQKRPKIKRPRQSWSQQYIFCPRGCAQLRRREQGRAVTFACRLGLALLGLGGWLCFAGLFHFISCLVPPLSQSSQLCIY